ncbi:MULTISPECIES: hypothetical protein [Photorhabdus]|uniref:Uncharacterized protein n=1 Tax=Photorhabdus kayaii TaxID=230088 RepID=A0ABX0AVG4_9GAMM|nr:MULTISPECIES: hypothetical protein [Photorhabdus]MCT8350435.1 hypothetical protein [Photorhabdus kayaii]MDB6368443.1 hypothetical protein [Photorhabdus bodei]NDL12402.1 hypothetical protein [Photorhabdus kayaii]NDL24751.1 hypothetical protein [Photorhabdus kayaii]
MTGVSERSQQRGNLKDDRYIRHFYPYIYLIKSIIQQYQTLFYNHN